MTVSERACYYVKDKGKRVLIPGCWSTVESGKIEDCTCDRPSEKTRLEKLEMDVARIKKILDKITKHQTPEAVT